MFEEFKLVNKFNEEVKPGDEVKDFRGYKATYVGISKAPLNLEEHGRFSSGQVEVSRPGEPPEWLSHRAWFYPSVIDCRIVKRQL